MDSCAVLQVDFSKQSLRNAKDSLRSEPTQSFQTVFISLDVSDVDMTSYLERGLREAECDDELMELLAPYQEDITEILQAIKPPATLIIHDSPLTYTDPAGWKLGTICKSFREIGGRFSWDIKLANLRPEAFYQLLLSFDDQPLFDLVKSLKLRLELDEEEKSWLEEICEWLHAFRKLERFSLAPPDQRLLSPEKVRSVLERISSKTKSLRLTGLVTTKDELENILERFDDRLVKMTLERVLVFDDSRNISVDDDWETGRVYDILRFHGQDILSQIRRLSDGNYNDLVTRGLELPCFNGQQPGQPLRRLMQK